MYKVYENICKKIIYIISYLQVYEVCVRGMYHMISNKILNKESFYREYVAREIFFYFALRFQIFYIYIMMVKNLSYNNFTLPVLSNMLNTQSQE